MAVLLTMGKQRWAGSGLNILPNLWIINPPVHVDDARVLQILIIHNQCGFRLLAYPMQFRKKRPVAYSIVSEGNAALQAPLAVITEYKLD